MHFWVVASNTLNAKEILKILKKKESYINITIMSDTSMTVIYYASQTCP